VKLNATPAWLASLPARKPLIVPVHVAAVQAEAVPPVTAEKPKNSMLVVFRAMDGAAMPPLLPTR
jgi:hypothetical protein